MLLCHRGRVCVADDMWGIVADAVTGALLSRSVLIIQPAVEGSTAEDCGEVAVHGLVLSGSLSVLLWSRQITH